MSFINELGKPHKKRTINFFQLWDEILSSYIKKNDSDFGEHRTKNMYVDMTGLYSQKRQRITLKTDLYMSKVTINSYVLILMTFYSLKD